MEIFKSQEVVFLKDMAVDMWYNSHVNIIKGLSQKDVVIQVRDQFAANLNIPFCIYC